ncbi:hypothetical protein KZX46_22225 (plasmid) [Polymorphobacter sp. PAMC 29334]|uniref:alpha/beta hydrolase family esterase n=1 Tax=Polymorphobacter sp. PAMC 29334 TaxID=2862331 RepID=UPI001C752EDD|nr:hypothetical protein [Polymorphobacter sp. PAMC 29334]QYE37111.1 hypothetical protein KZX46_22225 [Polymorphobacter sp. PAMC 29334]
MFAPRRARPRPAALMLPLDRNVRALVVELHGSGLDARRQRELSGLAERLLAQGIAVLFPQGVIPFRITTASAPGFAWAVPGAPLPGGNGPAPTGVDDCGWIEALVEKVQGDLSIGAKPLFIAGYSGGARLASHLVVRGRSRWSAAGLVAGLRAVAGGHRAPPPTITFHGVEDIVNPYHGADGDRWDIGVEAAGERYAAMQGCPHTPSDVPVVGGRLRRYSTASATMLTMYGLVGAGHAWPGSTDADHLRMFGPMTGPMNASDFISTFFAGHLAIHEGRDRSGDGRGRARSVEASGRDTLPASEDRR